MGYAVNSGVFAHNIDTYNEYVFLHFRSRVTFEPSGVNKQSLAGQMYEV